MIFLCNGRLKWNFLFFCFKLLMEDNCFAMCFCYTTTWINCKFIYIPSLLIVSPGYYDLNYTRCCHYKMPSTGPDIQVWCLFPKHLTFHVALNLILTRSQASLLLSEGWLCCQQSLTEAHAPKPPRYMHRVFLLLKETGLMRETVGHIFMGRREREEMASVDSGKGLRPAGECFTAHLKGSPVSDGFSSSCSCLWARVNHLSPLLL